ncbi:RNA exonuclease 4 [Grifola frondosa]|uniref:RNA exonuclease 4 n=1 Tax=Grifola frondosa TaxID=5627 RepID=A0A1C7MSE6_GRIFR|nr:RNA exonuclease 4 [Grifola frondosa]
MATLHHIPNSCFLPHSLLALHMASNSSTHGHIPSGSTLPMAGKQPQKFFPSRKYVAVQAQLVYYGIISRLPMVARVTITDYRGNVVLDSFVRPTQPVSDYRTNETGLQPAHLENAPTFIDVQRQVAGLIRNKIIVGYALWNFLSVLGLSHPAIDTRDVALFLSFRRSLGCKPTEMLPLTTLVKQFMGRDIMLNGDIPVEQARSALDLFRSCEQTWEGVIASGAWPCALPPLAHAGCFT